MSEGWSGRCSNYAGEFLPGEGPKLEALRDSGGLAVLRESIDENVLAPIYEAARRVRDALDHKIVRVIFI
jgi:hypothetical protein